LLHFGEEKMSKSTGNLITIKEALKRYSADAIRIFVLSSHYRSPLTYSEEALEAAEGGAERLLRVVSRQDIATDVGNGLDAESYRRQFIEAMDDDFSAPQAMGILFDLARAINQAADCGTGISEAKTVLVELARDVLGLKLETFKPTDGKSTDIKNRINCLIEQRNKLRKEKKWAEADKAREELELLGATIEDTPSGTNIIWKRKG
jgi:cysteinyl-tRNA synthetase